MINETKKSWPEHWIDDRHEQDGIDKTGIDEHSVEILQGELCKLQVKMGTTWATDDVSGAVLNAKQVQQARQVEMGYFRRMGVYHKVPRPQGVMTIKARWIDVNKGDTKNPDDRSRLVGKEYNDGMDPSLFAGTPPLEALRLVISRAGTEKSQKKIMVNDVKRAYFHAKATRDIYVEIPAEDKTPGEGDVVGKLQLCLYGTRDAALNWQLTVKSNLETLGFKSSAAFPNIYYHEARDICTLVHGDDYASSASESNLKWLKKNLEERFEIKTTVIGHEKSDEHECKFLNRIVRAVESGWEYEADMRHAKLIAEQMGVGQGKGVATAGVDAVEEEAEGDVILLNDEETTNYRSLVARGNYLSFDRPDTTFAVKELSRDMSKPTVQSWNKLKRLA